MKKEDFEISVPSPTEIYKYT